MVRRRSALALALWVALAVGLAGCAPAQSPGRPTPTLIIIRAEDGMPPIRASATQTAARPLTTAPLAPTRETPTDYPLPTATATPTGAPAAYP